MRASLNVRANDVAKQDGVCCYKIFQVGELMHSNVHKVFCISTNVCKKTASLSGFSSCTNFAVEFPTKSPRSYERVEKITPPGSAAAY